MASKTKNAAKGSIMATPPITMGVQSPNIAQQLLGSVAQGQGIAANRQAMDQSARNSQIQDDEYNYQLGIRKLQVIGRLAQQARQLKTPEQRAQFVQSINPQMLQSVGIDPAQAASVPLDDAGLDNYIAQVNSVLPQDKMQQRVQSSQILDDGTTIQILSNGQRIVTDPAGNRITGQAAVDAIRQANEYGTRLQGERAGSRTTAGLEARAIIEPELKANIKQAEQDVKLATEPEIKSAERTAVQSAENRTVYKTQALAAAENVPTLKRAIQLQKEINSGGGANALRRMANYLGVSSADEGELNSLFGQNILGQLKSTFGGNPTEGERQALEQAQASFSQTGKINIRLLENALKLADLRIRRGRSAARQDNDNDTLSYIDDALSIEFGDEPVGATPGINPNASTSGGWSIRPLGN